MKETFPMFVLPASRVLTLEHLPTRAPAGLDPRAVALCTL